MKFTGIWYVIVVALSAGCATSSTFNSANCDCRHQTLRPDYDGSPEATGPTLAKALEALGITETTLTRLRFVGEDSTRTSGLTVNLQTDEDLAFFWHYAIPAEPFTYWVPSGSRRVELFITGAAAPSAVLGINETGSCFIVGQLGRYMCRDMGDWVTRELQASQEKNG